MVRETRLAAASPVSAHENDTGRGADAARGTGAGNAPSRPNDTGREPPSPFPAGLIERWLARSPSQWSADDLLAFARAHAIRLVSLMHVGGDGLVKTLDFVPRDEAHFRTILLGGERADGSSLFPGIETDSSDVVLAPRLHTAFMDPFSPAPTLALLCGHFGADRRPLPTSPDTILRLAHARVLDDIGIDLWALGEIEFFLGRRSDGRANDVVEDHNYHATSPFVFGEELRRMALCHLGEIGIPVKYGHSEVGAARTGDRDDPVQWEQHEVELALMPLPMAAEAVMLTGWVLRKLADRMEMMISFAPMLSEGHPGNGLHFHLSPRVSGRHVDVLDTDGELTEPARWLIGGLAQMGGALMAFGNRAPASFIRLRQGKEAPTAVTWGHRDRKALIRIPIVAHDSGDRKAATPTVEFRLPDGSAHQHLLLAGIAQALVVGHDTPDLSALLVKTASLNARQNGRSVASIPSSPGQIAEALRTVREKLEAGQVFPPEVIDSTIAAIDHPKG